MYAVCDELRRCDGSGRERDGRFQEVEELFLCFSEARVSILAAYLAVWLVSEIGGELPSPSLAQTYDLPSPLRRACRKLE